MMDGNIKQTIRVATIAVAVLLAVTTAVEGQRTTSQRPATRRGAALAAERKRAAEDERAKGFILGAYTIAAPGLSVSGGEMDGAVKTGFGPGAGVMIGYGFNRIWSSFVSLDLAKQNASAGDYEGSFGLAHFEVGARANLPYGSPTNLPYVSASVGRRGLGARVDDQFDGTNYDLRLTGLMFGVGGGVQHVLSPTLMLDGGVELGFGSFGHYDADGESGTLDVNGSTSVRLKFGVTWRPSSHRST
jgi:hypothetical protein